MNKGKHTKNNNLPEVQSAGLFNEKLFQPAMLLFISQKPTHGYELIQSLSKSGFTENEIEPATVYRNLRRMEESGFLKSCWDTEGHGPARRLYEITADGFGQLKAWGDLLKKRKEKLEEFISLFNKTMSSLGLEGSKGGKYGKSN